jgi:nitrite reductase/ring-hydroxylating ferredoxin subunit
MPFVRVAAASDVPPGTARAYTVGRYDVALFNAGGQFYALENSCPHQGGPIAEGWLEDCEITCPWHGWCFDVRSGKMTLGDFARIARFAVDVRGSDLYVSTEPLAEETDD